MPYPIHTLDVFTSEPLGGNPLAVVLDADHLDAPTMQRIAGELGLSETVFVLPPTDPRTALRRLRIFTPAVELPFAGHPTIGTAILLADLGFVPGEGSTLSFALEEQVGRVPLTVRRAPDDTLSAMLTAAKSPESGPPPPEAGVLAHMLGLSREAIVTTGLGPRAYSAGWPYVIVPLRDEVALARARLDLGSWKEHLANFWAPSLYLVVRGTGPDSARIRARMFGPALGIPEDPATGAAALDLIGYLVDQDRPGDGTHRWVVDQGVEMGRPSRLIIEADVAGRRVRAARLAGSARRMIDGTLRLP